MHIYHEYRNQICLFMNIICQVPRKTLHLEEEAVHLAHLSSGLAIVNA